MNSKNIEKAIVNYLVKQADSDDLELLSEWIKSPENQRLFDDYVKMHYKITLSMHNADIQLVKTNLLKCIKKEKKKSSLFRIRKFALKPAAAILIGLLATSYFFKDYFFDDVEYNAPIILNNTIETGVDKAILTLENGQEITFVKGDTLKTPNAISNGEELVYKSVVSSAEVKYNTLTIPRGGQFFVKLSDGTQVWLNSETKLKYPVNFIEGETRQVELVYGEAYFKVSHSTEHGGASFIVVNDAQEVEVLGTEFNIKAYLDEVNIYTTLVNGSVSVVSENKKEILKPNEQFNLNKNTKDTFITFVDVYDQVSWKQGVFSFKRKNLKSIMQVLSRWYDMEVYFENKEIENIGFNGVLGKEQNIQEILETIKHSGSIKNYEINNKQVVLK